MNAILKLVQGSPAWHAHRAQYRNASESAAVMGISPWLSPYQFWLVRTGRKQQPVTAAMQHGTEMEPQARAAYEAHTGMVMQPQVLTEGDYSASLDGITLEGDLLLEVKCPYQGKTSKLWQAAVVGDVPEYYAVQIQHQLMVAGAANAHLWIFDGSDGLLLAVSRDEAVMASIRAAWDSFQPYLDNDTPPPLTDQDTFARDDLAWQQAAQDYLGWKSVIDEAQTKADNAKARLVELTTYSRESGCGVTVTKYWKQGNVDYKKVPELGQVNLDSYRGLGREEVRVTVVK